MLEKDDSYPDCILKAFLKKLHELYDGCHEVPTELDECNNLLGGECSQRLKENEFEEQEQNRRLYVALTRAREAVILTSAIDLTKEGIGPRYTRKITDALFERAATLCW